MVRLATDVTTGVLDDRCAVSTLFFRALYIGAERTNEHQRKKGNGATGARRRSMWPRRKARLFEFSLAKDGMYPIVTHAFSYVSPGALGLIQAGDGASKK
jgi:hypothetical protein